VEDVKMAERFIGMTVALTLSNNSQLKGTVSKVDSTTQILHLHEGTYCFIGVEKEMLSLVTFLPSGAMIPEYSIEASHISSLEIVPSGPAQVEPPSITLPAPAPAPAQAQEFHDPAILSVYSSGLQGFNEDSSVENHLLRNLLHNTCHPLEYRLQSSLCHK